MWTWQIVNLIAGRDETYMWSAAEVKNLTHYEAGCKVSLSPVPLPLCK